MDKKIRVYHFHNGSGGGVLSVIKNLVLFSDQGKFEHHGIYTIDKTAKRNYVPPAVPSIASEKVFYYSPDWNFYHTCRKLSLMIPDENAVIVANDWLELGMLTAMGRRNPVVQIVHGDYDYYYNLSGKHDNYINAYAAVAETISHRLRTQLTNRKEDIVYLPFPVPKVSSKSFFNASLPLNLVFVGRLTKEKGYDLLPQIDHQLRKQNLHILWNIVGDAPASARAIWDRESSVHFHGELPNEQVTKLMLTMDCLLLPSLAEGMPVTVVEAMKAGLTCLVNSLAGGIAALIIDGETGYKIPANSVSQFVERLKQIHFDRQILKDIGAKARQVAAESFDPVVNTARYDALFEQCFRMKRIVRQPSKVYGSRLDHPLIPNPVVCMVRTLVRHSNNNGAG